MPECDADEQSAEALAERDRRIERVAGLFDRHATSVYHVAWRILWSRADAEDVTQITFLRAFERLDQLRDSTRAKPWLLQTAYHASLEVLRRRRDVPTDPADLPDRPSTDDPARDVETADTLAMLRDAVDRLPGALRVAFVLRDVEGLSTHEVAAALGVGESAVKMRVARAREQLRQALQGKMT